MDRDQVHTTLGHLDHLYDLRHINLGTENVIACQTRTKAIAKAKTLGWGSQDVLHAYNRFNRFWVIGQFWGEDVGFYLATEDGSAKTIPIRK